MAKKILCAVDGTNHSQHALETAASMAQAMKAELVVLVVDQVLFDSRSAPIHTMGEDKAKQVLAAAQEAASAAGYSSPTLAAVAGRDVARAILNYAEDHAVDHIVVGTGEKSTATRLVVGSVSHDLVVRAHCSVTVAR